MSKISTNLRFISLVIIVIMVSSSIYAGVNQTHTVKTVHMDNELQPMQATDSNPLPTAIKPTALGDFDNPIDIPLTLVGQNRVGSKVFQVNSTFPFIYFKYNINDTAPVSVSLQAASGQSIDLNNYEVYFDVNDPTFNFVGYATTFDTQSLPIGVDFPAATTGYFISSVSVYDLINYELTTSFNLNLTIQQFPKGQVPGGKQAKSQLFQSQGYDTIFGMQNYLETNGYLDFNLIGSSLATMNVNDPDYVKTVGLTIYGLVKAGAYVASSAATAPADKEQTYANYLNVAFSILSTADAALLEQNNQTFYYRPNESNPIGDVYTLYLKDNAYLALALGELYWYGSTSWDGLSIFNTGLLNYNPLALANRLDLLDNALPVLFKYSPGDYRDKVTISVYTGYLAPYITSGAFTRDSIGVINYLESYALIAESFYWASLTTEMDGMTTFLNANMTIISSPDVQIQQGVYARFYDNTVAGAGVRSNVTDLLGNAILLAHLQTYYSGLHTTSFIGTTQAEILSFTNNFGEDILNVFQDGVSGLLYDSVNVTATAQNTEISTLGNSFMILAMNRLLVAWNDFATITGQLDHQLTARKWTIRLQEASKALFDNMYDAKKEFFFPLYNAGGKFYAINDTIANSNLMIANTFPMAWLADLFPVQLDSLVADNLIVGTQGQLTLELSLVSFQKPWSFYDPYTPQQVDIDISITKFGFSVSDTVQLQTNFDASNNIILTYNFPVEKRGSYTININLSSESNILLAQTIDLTALGQVSLESGLQQFDLTDSTFTTDISFIDETGAILPALQVRGALGLGFADSKATFEQKYIRTTRTDSSGKLELTFNTADLSKDGLINTTELFSKNPTPLFTNIKLFLNVTNAASFNLETDVQVVDVQVRLSRVNLRTSPSNLQLTQGTTDSFTFSVTAQNQYQEAIANAKVDYTIVQIPSVKNSVFTDSDGEATITFRDSDLFALSDLAIFLNKDNVDHTEVNATIKMTFSAENYPTRSIFRQISILPNDIKITANPVTVNIKQANILQRSSDIQPLVVEVATEDLFSRVIPAMVSIHWLNPATDTHVSLAEQGTHVAPYAFSINPKGLPAGNYTLVIEAVKDGITSTVNIDAVSGGKPNTGLDLAQGNQIVVPKTLPKSIFVEASTVQDVILTGLSLILALILTQGGRLAFDYGKTRLLERRCPSCEEYIDKSTPVCKYCGRDTNFKGVKPAEAPRETEAEQPAKSMDESS